jgi:hypothetical protein
MSQSRIAEWSYYFGCLSAAVTIVYRALLLAVPRLFATPRVVPHQFLELSILALSGFDREHCAGDGSSRRRESCCRGQSGMSALAFSVPLGHFETL